MSDMKQKYYRYNGNDSQIIWGKGKSYFREKREGWREYYVEMVMR